MTTFEERLLKTLESIDGTLKHIEQSLMVERQKSASSATLEDNGKYVMEAVQTAIHDTFQEEEKK